MVLVRNGIFIAVFAWQKTQVRTEIASSEITIHRCDQRSYSTVISGRNTEVDSFVRYFKAKRGIKYGSWTYRCLLFSMMF